jgi:hypothetical protein
MSREIFPATFFEEIMSTMSYRFTVVTFLSLFMLSSGAYAQSTQRSQAITETQKTDAAQSEQLQEGASTLSLEEVKAQKELETLKSRPEEYRVLLLGVQIFLGRFGYGTGPYTGKLDEKTQTALREYQQYMGLPETGEVDFRTLKSLTTDNQILDKPLPFLPQATFHLNQWDKAIQVQGTWAGEGGLTMDAVQTSKITCFREEKQCIESTAVLTGINVPILEVLTHVYAIKEWDDEKLVSAPYEGEPCSIIILRMNRQQKSVTRFVAYQQNEGVCQDVETKDVLYYLVNGPQVYATLKEEKAKETKRILRVKD